MVALPLCMSLSVASFVPRLHDQANIEQTSSKLFKINVPIARRLLDVRSMFANIHPASSTSYGN